MEESKMKDIAPVQAVVVDVIVQASAEEPKKKASSDICKCMVVAAVLLVPMIAAVTAIATPSCPAINVAASTTTAGASCAGGAASDSPTCEFSCASTYYHTGASVIACGADGRLNVARANQEQCGVQSTFVFTLAHDLTCDFLPPHAM